MELRCGAARRRRLAPPWSHLLLSLR
jgi:hypothetical protein